MIGCVYAKTETKKASREMNGNTLDTFKAKEFSHLLGMPGFSDKALEMHFKLYKGYVKNTNTFISSLREMTQEGNTGTPEFQELKRRQMWEFDGMRLHELYFQNLGGYGTELDSNSALYQELIDQFGSIEKWKSDFLATGALRGIGWVVLYRDPNTGMLTNAWIEEHANKHMAGGAPILIMDVWEHAYITDYGIDRKAYMEAFYKNINWSIAEERFQKLIQQQEID